MSAPARPMTNSILCLARATLEVSSCALAPYACIKSKHRFTQPQLFTILVLRHFRRTDYRGIVQELHDNPQLCGLLGLKNIPHFTTLQKAEQRLLKKTAASSSWTTASNAPVPPAWSSPAPQARLTEPVLNAAM